MSANFVEQSKQYAQKVYGNTIDECGYPVLRRLQWDAEQFTDDDCRSAAYLQGVHQKTGNNHLFTVGIHVPMRSEYAARLLYYDPREMTLNGYLDRVFTHDYASAILLADLQYRMNPDNYTTQGADTLNKCCRYRDAYITSLRVVKEKHPEVLSFFKNKPVDP